MIHQIIRASNQVWNSMYYDNLMDCKDYQVSITKKADRLYFNCAHVMSKDDETTFSKIETIFFENALVPAIYYDPASPKGLEEKLIQRGYKLVPDELEHWHALSLNKNSIAKLKSIPAKNPKIVSTLQFELFKPQENEKLFAQFLAMDQLANEISDPLLHKLEENLLNPQDEQVKFICCIGLMDGVPASSGLIALLDNYAFFSEGATHPHFRRQGIYTDVRRTSVLCAYQAGCTHAFANCDKNAYSNNTYQNLGFQKIFSRDFYQLSIK